MVKLKTFLANAFIYPSIILLGMSSNKQNAHHYFLKKFGRSTLALAAAPLSGLAAEEKVKERILAFYAAAPCLACIDSYFEKKIIYWTPDDTKRVKA
jgi:hypothetical protein